MLKIGKPIQYNLFDETTDLNEIIQKLNNIGPNWSLIKTRTSTRHIESIDPKFIPLQYSFLNNIIYNMLIIANQTITDNSKMIPIQLFLCFYKSGSDHCPMHKHQCRQLTLSLGSERIMKVSSKEIILDSGSLIYLHGQMHGIPKNSDLGPRISLNLFFTTTSEMQGTS